jgi:hypothetical protein
MRLRSKVNREYTVPITLLGKQSRAYLIYPTRNLY